MIKVDIYQDQSDVVYGFRMEGHAGYADAGEDIVCAAVSALVINTINSIEAFTDEKFENAVHREKDVVTYSITSRPVGDAAKLLLKSLVLGLQGIEQEYGKKFIKVKIKRKQEV